MFFLFKFSSKINFLKVNKFPSIKCSSKKSWQQHEETPNVEIVDKWRTETFSLHSLETNTTVLLHTAIVLLFKLRIQGISWSPLDQHLS